MRVDISILAKFMLEEFSNDAIFVSEWLDNSGYFDSEEDRDYFIERIKSYVVS